MESIQQKKPRRIYGGIIRHFDSNLGQYVYAVVWERHADAWSFPKGTWKASENARQCADRKIEQETSIKGLPLHAHRIHVGWTHLYLFTVPEKYELRSKDKTVSEARWMTVEDLEKQKPFINLGIQEFLQRMRKGTIPF